MSAFAVLSRSTPGRKKERFGRPLLVLVVAAAILAPLVIAGPVAAAAKAAPFGFAASSGKWSIEPTPTIEEKEGLLAGISCPGPTTCFAVGDYLDAKAISVAEVEEWNGKSWSQLAVARPGGSDFSELDAISCTSKSFCVAVGYSSAGALSETWNGSTWKLSSVPGSDTAPQLTGVSCPDSDFCLAAGIAYNSEAIAIAYKWNGSKWVAVAFPSPKGAIDVQAEAVSCSTAKRCEVVGSYGTKSVEQAPLGEGWNGRSLTVQRVPLHSAAAFSDLDGVSCVSHGCMAVGSFLSGSSADTLAELWNGTNWAVTETPNPSGSQGSALTGVSCSTFASCEAVGSTDDSTMTLATRWNGEKWSLQSTPRSAATASLSAISCVAPDSCVGVGAAVTVENPSLNLSEDWDGKDWSIQTIATPRGYVGGMFEGVSCSSRSFCIAAGIANSLAPVSERWNGSKWSNIASTGVLGAATLDGVSCVSSTYCVVVGFLFSAQGVAGQWNGKSWKPMSTPAGPSNLTGVSCVSRNSCLAVGFSTDNQGLQRGLAESWNGKTWTRSFPVRPKDSADSQLNSTSCTAADSCEAVGVWENRTGVQHPLVEFWNGQKWSLQGSATGSKQSVTLTGVSCPQSSVCLAVGYSFDKLGRASNFSESWNGKRWVSRPAPTPEGGSQLFGIACSSIESCTAVGGTLSAPIAEGWNGAKWSLEHAAGPSGRNETSALQAVSCSSDCTAVGYAYATSSARGDPLVEVN